MMVRRLWRMQVCAVLALCLPVAGWAACTRHPALNTSDGFAAFVPFGRVNLLHPDLQPPGSLLAATQAKPTDYNANAETLLWTCAKSDLPQLYFLIATNGNAKAGGYWNMHEQGSLNALPFTYATWFEYVGLRLSIGDKVINRWWQKIDLTAYEDAGQNIHIKLKHLPTMQAELFKLSMLPSLTAGSAAGAVYACNSPNAYIQLHGPGLNHDDIGVDSASAQGRKFMSPANGFGYRMTQKAWLSNVAGCVVRNNTPLVQFAPITVQQLSQGMTQVENFFVEIECANNAVYGTGVGQNAMGIQVSLSGNHHAVVTLSNQQLTTTGRGVTHIVADDYDSPNAAKGVGVTIQNPGFRPNGNIVLIGQPGLAGQGQAAGNNAGWYGANQGAINLGATGGYRRWRQNFTATFGRIKTMTVTPGNFQATATVLVKVH